LEVAHGIPRGRRRLENAAKRVVSGAPFRKVAFGRRRRELRPLQVWNEADPLLSIGPKSCFYNI